MKIEFCCNEMGQAFRKDIIKVDVSSTIVLVLNANRFSRLEYCPYCGEKIELIIKGDEE